MNKDQFWESIDTVIVAYPDYDRESHMNITIEKLLNYSLDDIVDWQMMLEEYCNAAYRPEVWAAGQVLGADYTGEGFIDFACWLVSRGKEVYMDALRDPATMFAIPLNGESPSFKQFRFTAYNAYDAKLFHTDPTMSGNLFKAMANHTLASQTVEAIRQEIPPCSVFAQSWQRRLNPSASDVKEPQTMAELLQTNNLACGYVYKRDQCTQYVFHNTPKNIAYFLGSRPTATKMVVTDALDRLILDMVGNFIDRCPDQELLEEVKKTLIPIQTGEVEAGSFFCPTLDEMEQYCNQRTSSPEAEIGLVMISDTL